MKKLLTLLVPALLAAALQGSLGACSEATGESCCKVCSAGKACGDSCIAQNLTCNVGSGCACNAAVGRL